MQITNLPQIPSIFTMPSMAEARSIPLLQSDDGLLYNLASLNALADSLLLRQQPSLLVQLSDSVRELLSSVARLEAMFPASTSYDAIRSNQLLALSELTASFAERYNLAAQSLLLSGLSDLPRSSFSLVEAVFSRVSELRNDLRIDESGLLKNTTSQPPVVLQNPLVPTAAELNPHLQRAASSTKQQTSETRRHELEPGKKKQDEAKQTGFFEGLKALFRKIFKRE